MVGFKEQDIGILEALLCVVGITAEVCADAGLFLPLIDAVSDRVGGIVGNVHRIDLQISDGDRLVGTDADESAGIDVLKLWHFSDCLDRAACGVNGHLGMLCDHGKSGDMVCVFVGQENAVDIGHIEADFLQGVYSPLSADAHIHQDVGVGGTHINTIAAAAAGNTFKSHGYYFLFLILIFLFFYFLIDFSVIYFLVTP